MDSRQEKNKKIREKLEEEEKRSHRKKIVLLTIKIFFIILTVLLSLFFYTKYCSTKGIIIKETRIKEKKIPDDMNGIKIIQFSDLYYGTTIFQDEVKTLVKIINERKPDIVVFTGNLIAKDYHIKTKETESIIQELQKIDTSIGKFAISGKYDYDEFKTIMNQSDFTILDNEYDLIYHENNTPILLVGMSSLIQEKRNVEKAYQYFNEENHNANIYTISIMSETDGLDDLLAKYPTDLVLAGNSLNGQIRIPGLGGVIKQTGSNKYKDAYYQINQTKLYISSGIGSPSPGFRIFSRPSINFFRITNKDS